MNEAVRLDTLSGVRAELGRVYRLAKNGRIDIENANALTYMLHRILHAIRIEREAQQAMQRLAEAEGLLAALRGAGRA